MKARAFTRRVPAVSQEQEDALAREYAAVIASAAAEASSALTAMTAAADWQPPPEGTILDSAVLANRAAARARFIHEKALDRVARGVLKELGIDWDITHPLSKALLSKVGRRTGERLGEQVQGTLRATLERAYAEGLSVRDTAQLVRQEIRDAAPWQARMLAQTDLNGLSNGGSVMAATLAGMPYKTWLATNDAKTRDDHADADGQTVPVDQPFNVGGELAEFPGDPALSDANAANCRCTVIYADELTGPDPMIAGGGTMTDALTAAAKPQKWEGVLVREGVRFEDGRKVRKGATTWREPPLSLMALTITDDGHKGAYLAGRIDEIWRDGDRIRGRGVFNTNAAGKETVALVKDESLRGISVDFAVQELSVMVPEESLEEDGSVTIRPAEMDFVEAVIGMATVCPFQANEDALIELVASAALRELVIDADADPLTVEALEHSSDFLTAAALGDLGKIETVVTDGELVLVGESLEDRLEAAWDNLAATADLSARADQAEQRADDLERQIAVIREEHEAALTRVANEQALVTMRRIEELTAQLAKPRRVTLERDEAGALQAVATQD